MNTEGPPSSIIQFGPFEADLASGELRKNGIRLKLQDQPFQVLAALLARPGELVTREELRRRLWADDTFVDFDNALNTAVNKIREVLEDSARRPRFVETIARRGYRWIGIAPISPETEEPAQQPHGKYPMRYGAAVTLAVALIAMAVWVSREAAVPEEPPQHPLRAVPLTSYEGSESTPTFSPDGSQVAFSWDGGSRKNFDIYALVIGSASPLRLTENPALDTAPAWSPDGRYIAFIRSTGERGEGAVYLISPLGGSERKLVEGVLLRLNQYWPAKLGWSPDGKTLYFAVWQDGAQAISSVDVETGDKRAVTSPPRLGDYSLAVSPDGEMLAFARLTEGLASTLYLTPSRGGDPRRLFPVLGSASLAWMPDGKEILYGSTQAAGFTPSLWKIAAAGGEPQRLPILDEGGLMPAVSPSGQRLIYVRRSIDVNIWRYDRPQHEGESWKPKKLSASTYGDYAPQISPDGERIVYASTRSGSTQLWVAQADGSNSVQLTSLEPMAGSPRWSPDGRSIVFDARPKGNADIYVVDSQGGLPRPIVVAPGDQTRPSWSHDGKWIYFASNDTGSQQIWKVPAQGGDRIRLTEGTGSQPFESFGGRYVYYQGAEGTIWRVPVDGGKEVAVVRQKAPIFDRWDVTADRIYFAIEERDESTGSSWWIKSYRFDTQEVSAVSRLERPPQGGTPLDVSPDGKWLVYAQLDRNDSDLMLVEDFR